MSDSESPENESSTEETTNTTAETTTTEDVKANALSKFMELKDSNPKVFFGGIGGGVVLLLLIVMMGGGSKNQIPQTSMKKVSIGQEYTLKGANSTSESSTISLGAAANITAFDDSEEEGEKSVCKQQPSGTSVKILEVQGTFAQVEILSEGNCQGRKKWAFIADIK